MCLIRFGGLLMSFTIMKRETAWHLPPARKFNAFIVAPNALLAAGQEGSQAFLAAVNLQDGSYLWQEKLPAPAVKGGLACDHQARVLISLSDGRTLCYGPVR